MYNSTDPRSKLTTTESSGSNEYAPAAATYARFHELQPSEAAAGVRTWYARAQNFIVAYSECERGTLLERSGQADEYVLLLPDAGAVVMAGAQTAEIPGRSLVFIPPGDSRIVMPAGGRAIRLLTVRADDLAARCWNAATYAEHNPLIPPFQPWPDPPAGFRIRYYSIDPAPQPGRFGQIWRCTTFMVNVFPPAPPRPLNKLSPHEHEDFEQCSLAVEGDFMHHLRWPWTFDIAQWREDEHERCPAPSIAVIPPKVLHTSAASAPAGNVLVDIFSPPRRDFSTMPGWVLNAAEYPAPDFE